MSKEELRGWYLLLDSDNRPLTRGHMETPPDAPSIQIKVPKEKMKVVLEHEELELVSLEEDGENLLGRILLRRGDCIFLEKIKRLGAEVREHLRMPVRFESFIYPLTGSWTGRYPILSVDLSCGGIAFYCDGLLEDGEEMEIVVPITAQPLILRCKILRHRPGANGMTLYSAEFAELCHDEERMTQEAVFAIQLKTRL